MERLEQRAAALGTAVRLTVALLLGSLLALAQPPASVPAVIFFVVPGFLLLLRTASSAARAAGIGWVCGTGYFSAALFWIVEPFQIDPELHGWLAPFALVGMSGGLALFWAAAFGTARMLPIAGLRQALAFACLLAGAEVARSYVLTGLPWALIGYAWVETPVIQLAALVGVTGLGFLSLLAAVLPVVRLPGLGQAGGIVLAVALVGLAWAYGAVRLTAPVPERTEAFVVRLVQPNAPQHLKWRADMQAVFFQRHLRMTAAEGRMGRPDAVIWSETAVPFALGYSDQYQSMIAAAAGGAPVILGTTRVEVETEAERWYNSLAILGSDGEVDAVYDKHHLVPFGEYIPLQQVVRRFGGPTIETLTRGGFTSGDGPHVIGSPGVPPLLPLVCYEAIFPRHARAPEGRPEWLVQITNDAWFGTLSGPFQHYAQNRVRAIEQGLPLVRVANTGISAVIDPYGREVVRIDLLTEGFVDAALPGALAPTLFARVGEQPSMFAILIVFGLTFTKTTRRDSRFVRS